MTMPVEILVYCPSEEDIISPRLRTRKRNPNGSIHYHCPITECKYAQDKERWFSSMKLLRQHFQKVHTTKVNCEKCKSVILLSSMDQHLKTCGQIHSCPEGCADFISRSALVMHCSRKHPKLHQTIIKRRYSDRNSKEINQTVDKTKESETKKCRDQGTQIEKRTKRPKTNLSPKPKALLMDTFTQTITKLNTDCNIINPDNVKTSSSTQTNIRLTPEPKTCFKYCGDDHDSNSIQTQTALDELVYMKNDDLLLNESVYLSDTQTQTWPMSFNHDSAISIETQTIENMFDFGFQNNGNFLSDFSVKTEQNNGLLDGPRHNVFAGSCFEESLIDSPKNFSEGGDF